jgi:RecJ-like exonuclease
LQYLYFGFVSDFEFRHSNLDAAVKAALGDWIMVSGTEMKALKTVEQESGKTSTRLVSRQLGIDPAYARTLCMNLSKDHYLDSERQHGHFQITSKGKEALGWISDSLQSPLPQNGSGKMQVEEFHWRTFSAARAEQSLCSSVFIKPGQEDAGWNAICVGSNGHNRFNGGIGRSSVSLLSEKTQRCGFCKGKGSRQKGVSCPVCRGAGAVTVNPPSVTCAYCKGTGEAQRRTALKCTVCGGKGVVSVSTPVMVCSRCRGTGEDPNSKLPCIDCQGKGVVRKQRPGNGQQTIGQIGKLAATL